MDLMTLLTWLGHFWVTLGYDVDVTVCHEMMHML